MKIEAVLLGLIGALLTPWFMNLFSGREKAARRTDGYKVLEYPLALRLLSLILGLACLGGAVLAFWDPGKFHPALLPWLIPCLVLGGLSNVTVYHLLGRASVFWSEHNLKGPDAFSRSVEMTWQEVVSVEYVDWAMGFRLRNERQESIWFSSLMIGFDEFIEEIKARNIVSDRRSLLDPNDRE